MSTRLGAINTNTLLYSAAEVDLLVAGVAVRGAVITLCGGFNPVSTGADAFEAVVPYAPDGSTAHR